MTVEEIYKVIKELVGPIAPLAGVFIDSKREDNLHVFLDVLEMMYKEADTLITENKFVRCKTVDRMVTLCKDRLSKLCINNDKDMVDGTMYINMAKSTYVSIDGSVKLCLMVADKTGVRWVAPADDIKLNQLGNVSLFSGICYKHHLADNFKNKINNAYPNGAGAGGTVFTDYDKMVEFLKEGGREWYFAEIELNNEPLIYEFDCDWMATIPFNRLSEKGFKPLIII